MPNPELPQFAAGSQFALVRQMILIDAQGRLVPSSLIESVQVRIYRKIPPGVKPNVEEAKQSQTFVEFRLSRPKLFASDAGGLRPVARDEKEFVQFITKDEDWFELGVQAGSVEKVRQVRMRFCAGCHSTPGIHSVNSYTRFFGPRQTRPPELFDTSPAREILIATRLKQSQYNWGLLEGLWQSKRPE